MIDILICGINGKMGRAVYTAAEKKKGVNVVCGVDKFTVGNFNCPVYSDIKDVLEHVDVIIDFSSPSALDGILKFATENNCAAVLATTGYTKKQAEEIAQAAETVPICLKPNMSAGIGALTKILPQIKKLLTGFDVSITETHRKGKKDKPSGTALLLAECMCGCGENSDTAEKSGCCEITSVRGGDVAGIHEINFFGEQEMISIKHTVFSREVFALGALDTCIKLHKLPPKLYNF